MRVLIVDDHPIVRAGLRRLLAGEAGIEMREATTGKEALAACREAPPDLVILDLNLPGIGGLETIRWLKLEHGACQILVLSMHADPLHAARALQSGATGYVSKNAPPEELVEAIRRVAEGRRYIEHEIAQQLALLNIRAPLDPLAELSRRDLEIMRLLGSGRSLAEIAEAIGVSYKTVANTCSQIKTKLGVARTAELIRIAVEAGLR